MNAKLTSVAIGAALLGSSGTSAGQPFGRDSVYAALGGSSRTPSKAMTAASGLQPGRLQVQKEATMFKSENALALIFAALALALGLGLITQSYAAIPEQASSQLEEVAVASAR